MQVSSGSPGVARRLRMGGRDLRDEAALALLIEGGLRVQEV
jgi:hypothetical protein